jgi:CheY-like chemotaxis protein
LIVDDHDGFRTFARGTLKPAGFTVTGAATGAEAADAARTIRPGLVLLDIQLPDSDGFEVARRLAAAPAGDPGSGRGADLDPRGARLRPGRGQPGRRLPAQGSALRRGAAPVPGPHVP